MIQPTNAQQQCYPQPNGANAVSINIFNPQAYGSAPQQQQGAVTAPYDYSNSMYQMPQASVYNQPGAYAQGPMYAQTMMSPAAQAPIAPAPQMMPDSVMQQPTDMQAPQTEEIQPQETAALVDEAAQTDASQQTAPQNLVNVDSLAEGLKNPDGKQVEATLGQIAELAQGDPEQALQVVTEPIMQSLVDVANQDTSALEGPTDEQIRIAEKMSKNEQLTQDEINIAENLCPKDQAELNKTYALYTLAMLQRLQKDGINQYIETQKANGQEPIKPIKLNELIGYTDTVNAINGDAIAPVKAAAIQAIAHSTDAADLVEATQDEINAATQQSPEAASELTANNELINSVKTAITNSMQSEDPSIKEAATAAAAKLGISDVQTASQEEASSEQTEA